MTPGGSSTVHIYTQTIHRTTQITTNLEKCGPCPVSASFTLAFALELRKKHGNTSVRVRKTCQGKKNFSQGKKNLSKGKVSGVTITHLQEHKTTVTTESV